MDEVFIRRVANPNPGCTGAEITPRGRNGLRTQTVDQASFSGPAASCR
jgi:hypothetical protein